MLKRQIVFSFIVGLAFAMGGVLFFANPSGNELSAPSASSSMPSTLAQLVNYSEVIVIASYQGVSNLGFATANTPDPTPTGVATSEPPSGFNIVRTSLNVDSIIRNNGEISANESVMLKRAGHIPASTAEAASDTDSPMPIVWPYDTEFILFLKELETSPGYYYLPYNACGRIVTVTVTGAGGGGVACSDAARTVPPFMSGLSKQQFLDAVATEVSSPSPSETPYPTEAPTATPTP